MLKSRTQKLKKSYRDTIFGDTSFNMTNKQIIKRLLLWEIFLDDGLDDGVIGFKVLTTGQGFGVGFKSIVRDLLFDYSEFYFK